MWSIIERLFPTSLQQRIAAKAARWVGTLVAGFLAAFLVKHLGVSLDVANLIGGDVNQVIIDGGTAAILGAITLAFSVKDAKKSDADIKQAAASPLPIGTIVAVPGEKTIVVGKPSLAVNEATEAADTGPATAALNNAELARVKGTQ